MNYVTPAELETVASTVCAFAKRVCLASLLRAAGNRLTLYPSLNTGRVWWRSRGSLQPRASLQAIGTAGMLSEPGEIRRKDCRPRGVGGLSQPPRGRRFGISEMRYRAPGSAAYQAAP